VYEVETFTPFCKKLLPSVKVGSFVVPLLLVALALLTDVLFELGDLIQPSKNRKENITIHVIFNVLNLDGLNSFAINF
jgi:hypothetical protein